MKKLLRKIMKFFEMSNPEEKTSKPIKQDDCDYLLDNKIMGLNYEIGIFRIY